MKSFRVTHAACVSWHDVSRSRVPFDLCTNWCAETSDLDKSIWTFTMIRRIISFLLHTFSWFDDRFLTRVIEVIGVYPWNLFIEYCRFFTTHYFRKITNGETNKRTIQTNRTWTTATDVFNIPLGFVVNALTSLFMYARANVYWSVIKLHGGACNCNHLFYANVQRCIFIKWFHRQNIWQSLNIPEK